MARVLIDSSVPHLDREFDYAVPFELDDAAQAGSRVTVRFNGRDVTGWLTERVAESATEVELTRLRAVLTAIPPLSLEVLELARAVAARQAGVVADVLRAAVPPRVAGVEREVLAEPDADHPVSEHRDAPAETGTGFELPEDSALWQIDGAGALLDAWRTGQDPAGAVALPSRVGPWNEARVMAEVAAAVAAAGRGVILVVPDQRDLDRLSTQLEATVGAAGFARLTAEDGQSARYRSHLRLLRGQVRIAVGTRSAIWAPVPDLALTVVLDDGDDTYAEPRAPYFHVRDVALLRRSLSGGGLLFLGAGRSVAVQRLVDAGWVAELSVARARRRQVGALVIATADSWESARDPYARRARLPHTAWATARSALTSHDAGPVLISVARAGFIPAVLCQTCRTPARCVHCAGPLAFADAQAAARGELTCRWCRQRERDYRCPECAGRTVRAAARGVDRTAEELGRAFPQVPVYASSAAHMLGTVPAGPAIVVATPGAEPVVAGGYAAALLLDGDTQLQHEGLDVGVRVLSRWFAAAGLVRGAEQGGRVVVTAEEAAAVGALTRGDPQGYARAELEQRRVLHLPPAGRWAEVTGPAAAVREYLDLVEEARQEVADTAPALPWIGPTPLPQDEAQHRALVMFPYAAGDAVVRLLRLARSAASARRDTAPVRVRVDPPGIL